MVERCRWYFFEGIVWDVAASGLARNATSMGTYLNLGAQRHTDCCSFTAISWRLNREIESLNEFASEYGFRFKVSNYPSWHYPGRCWFIEWYGEDSVDWEPALV